MLFLKILGCIVLLLLLLCLVRLRVRAEFREKTVVFLRAGVLHFQLYPAPTKEKPSKKKNAEPKAQKPSVLKEKLGDIPKPAAADIREAWNVLRPALLRALGRTRRGIRIDPLRLSLTLGGRSDPAKTAEYYGYANAAVWTVMPALEQLLVIPEPHIHLDMDFDAEKNVLQGAAGISIRIGTLILLALDLAIPAICWFRKYLKQKKAENATRQKTAETPAA